MFENNYTETKIE